MIELGLLVVVGIIASVAWRRTLEEQRLVRRLARVLGRYSLPPARRRVPAQGQVAPWERIRRKLDETLEYAGVPVRPAEYLRLVWAGLAGAVLVGFVIRGVGGSMVLAAAVVVIAWWWPVSMARARAERFREALPGALEAMAASLDAGVAVREAVLATAQDGQESVSEAFGEVAREVELGRRLEDATHALARRVQVEELTYFGAAIRLSSQTGADLAGLLRQMAQALRDRHEARAELRALTTQGRLSAYILTALPWGIAAVFYLMDPQYGHILLATRGGWIILIMAVVLLTLGWVSVQRILTAV